MQEQHPIEDLLNKINELLQFAQEHASTEVNADKITPEIEEKLAHVEEEVAKFKKISDDLVGMSGVSESEVQRRLSGESPVALSPAAKHLLHKAEELAFQAKSMGGEVPEGMRSDPRSKQKKSDTTGKERRKKFKRFGGDEKWKPL